MPTTRIRVAIVALFVCTVFASGCRGTAIEYVESGNDYSAEDALSIADSADPGMLAERKVADAPGLRSGNLSELRAKGRGAAEIAELLTRVFPPDTSAVPFYVERGSFEGTPAVFVVEAIGKRGGYLGDERIWVLSDSGNVLLTGTR